MNTVETLLALHSVLLLLLCIVNALMVYFLKVLFLLIKKLYHRVEEFTASMPSGALKQNQSSEPMDMKAGYNRAHSRSHSGNGNLKPFRIIT